MDSILEMQERFPTVCPGMGGILETQERFPAVCPGMDSILEMQERFSTVCPGMDSILEKHGYTDVAGRAKPDARAEGAVFNDRRYILAQSLTLIRHKINQIIVNFKFNFLKLLI